MTRKKGETNNPNGRPKGVPNKITADIKESFQSLVEGNLSNIGTWLEQVADKDPAKAIDLLIRLSEFILPKIRAVELTGKDGESLIPDVNLAKMSTAELIERAKATEKIS